MPNVAIIGSDGFIGSNLKEHFDMRSISYVGFSRNTPFISKATAKRILDLKITDIVFLATDLTPLRAETDFEIVELEMENLAKLLGFLVEILPSVNFIFPSSGGTVYSTSGIGKSETEPSEGSNAYGIFKAKCEQLVRSSALSYSILRISNVYGKNQRTGRGQGVIAEWVRAARQNEEVIVTGSLEQSRDFIYIDDLSRAFEFAVGKKNINEEINIGSGRATTLSELIEILRVTAGVPLIVDQKDARHFDVSQISLNVKKAQEILGWVPAVSVSDGIKLIW